MPDTPQTRKAGDALILSGQLNEGTPLDDAMWEGATGAINVVALDGPNSTEGTVYVDHAAVALTIDQTPKRYAVTLPAPIEDDIGAYVYEIEVTFPTLDDPLTWPNDRKKYKLKIVAQLA